MTEPSDAAKKAIDQEEVMLSAAGYDFMLEVMLQNKELRAEIEVLKQRVQFRKEDDH